MDMRMPLFKCMAIQFAPSKFGALLLVHRAERIMIFGMPHKTISQHVKKEGSFLALLTKALKESFYLCTLKVHQYTLYNDKNRFLMRLYGLYPLVIKEGKRDKGTPIILLEELFTQFNHFR